MAKRGRRKLHELEVINNRQYTQIITDKNNIKSIWEYDLDKVPNGPLSVEIVYPKSYKSIIEEQEKINATLPLTKRKFINPVNGKEVSYQRAKILNII
jgi:hypothetical protein